MQSVLDSSRNLEGSGLQASETTRTSRWPTPQMVESTGRRWPTMGRTEEGPSKPGDLLMQASWLALLLWLPWTYSPMAVSSLLASHHLGSSYLSNGVGFLLVGGELSGGG